MSSLQNQMLTGTTDTWPFNVQQEKKNHIYILFMCIFNGLCVSGLYGFMKNLKMGCKKNNGYIFDKKQKDRKKSLQIAIYNVQLN